MGEQEERAAFDGRHASESLEITVLTGTRAAGTGQVGGAELWTASAVVLAHVDEHGVVVTDEGGLSWLATDEDRGTWVHDLQALTQYVVRGRRASPDPAEYARHGVPVPDLTRHYALDEVLERDVHVPALDDRLRRYLEPVVVSTSRGDLSLDRSFGRFSGQVDWWGSTVRVSLAVDEPAVEGAETCGAALARLETWAADAPGTDARWRAYAAETLIDLANDWRVDDDSGAAEPVTPESFAGRIRLTSLDIEADGSATPFYGDGGLFWGHVIVVEVQPDGSMADASIAG